MQKGTTKRKYAGKVREAAVRLVMVDKVPAARTAADLGMCIHTRSLWVSQARRGAGVFTPPV